MKKLTLSDIIKKQHVDFNIIEYCYIDYHMSTPTVSNSGYPQTISPDIMKKTVKLNKKYPSDTFSQDCVDEVILKQHIEKLVEKDYTDDMNMLRTVYFRDLYLPTHDEKKTFRSKVQQLNSHIMMKGRIGRASTLIIDPKFVEFFDVDIHHLWSSYDFFTHKGLNNKIILAHINVSNSSEKMGYNMFHTDNYYAIEEIGDFDNLYHVLDIKCLKYDRTKKLQRILK